MLEAKDIFDRIESGEYSQKEDVTEALYYRIASGVFESSQCPRFARTELEKLGLPKLKL